MMNRIKSSFYKSLATLVGGAMVWTMVLAGNADAQYRSRDVARIEAGTTIDVRTNEAIDADDNDGRVFSGTVARDVAGRNGSVAIPRGSEVEMIVRRVNDDDISLDLDSVTIRGERYGVDTEANLIGADEKEGIGANSRTGKYVGGGALLGAIIGAITGGGKGAAIGAGAGAAAGAGAQILTRGHHVYVPSESLITFRLAEPMRLGAQDNGHNSNGVHYHSRDDYNTDSAAYREGYRAGRLDWDRRVARTLQTSRWNSYQDRRDYEAGYNAGYQVVNSDSRYGDRDRDRDGDRDTNRQKPAYGQNYRVSIGADKNIRWDGPQDSRIYVMVDNKPAQLFASGDGGTQRASWIAPGHLYVFVLRDSRGNELARDVMDLRR